MKVICFYPDYDAKHQAVLDAFARGAGAQMRDARAYEPCDVAVIFGAKKNSYQPTWPKGDIMERHKGNALVMIESAFVLRGKYWQVGFGGFAGHARFRNGGSPSDRWRRFGIPSKPRQERPDDAPVLVCGQVPWDTQVQDVDHPAWCRATVEALRAAGHRVRFRPHPKTTGRFDYGVPQEFIDQRPKIEDALAEARCVVTWNSTSAVDAILAGIPTITMDRGSIAWPVTAHRLEDAAFPPWYDPEQWLADLGYAQWNLQEMKDGTAWKHLTRA